VAEEWFAATKIYPNTFSNEPMIEPDELVDAVPVALDEELDDESSLLW
jgi:hypothetical protein